MHIPKLGLTVITAVLLSASCEYAHADVWVFEPSISLDQRVDDNYRINAFENEPVSDTRVVGTLGLSRESQTASIKGLARLDGLLTESEFESERFKSNQIAFLDANLKKRRSSYGISLSFKQDTPSRDISEDITDISSVAADTGASATQDQAVFRKRYIVQPSAQFNLTRRIKLESSLSYTKVKHEIASIRELQQQRFDALVNNPNLPDENKPASPDDVGVFVVEDELDDFVELGTTFGFRYKYSPITTLSINAGYSDFTSDVEIDGNNFNQPGSNIGFDSEIPDPRTQAVRRVPKRERRSNTARLRLGYDRAFSRTLNIGVQLGVFRTNTDDSDLFRESSESVREEARLLLNDVGRMNALTEAQTTESGWLAGFSFTKDTIVTRYSFRAAVDVLPSDVGSQVESLQVVSTAIRELGPLLDLSFRVRVYEPDSINSSNDDSFARRFLSFEPKLIWRFSRAWTAAGSYRYRRQKTQTDSESGQSNAILFSIKYTPPSAIRDAVKNAS